MSQAPDSVAFLSDVNCNSTYPEDSRAVSDLRRQRNPAEPLNLNCSSNDSRSPFSAEIEKPSAGRNSFRSIERYYQSWVIDWWLLDIAALGPATICLGAIATILAIYSGKPPSLPGSLNLNSILSILSQISTATLMKALVSSLSQQKWLRFRTSRKPLKDFGDFDEASRGPWGSFQLLRSKSKFTCVEIDWQVFLEYHLLTPTRYIGSLGALVVVLLQAFQPFIQQIVKYPTRWEAA